MNDEKPKKKKSSHVKKPKTSDKVKIESKESPEVKKTFGWYDPKYCQMLIRHMSTGKSFESFGGVESVWVGRSTLYDWAEKNPEFAEAREIGKSARLNQQEGRLMAMSMGIEIKNEDGTKTTYHPKHGKPQFIQWLMKCQNPDIYTDKKEIDHKSSDGSMKPTFIFEEVDGNSDED